MNLPLFTLFVLLTLGTYLATRWLFLTYRNPLLNPVFLSTVAIIALLQATGLTLEDYRPAKDAMTFLLGPATVALALPLYHNRQVLKKYALPVLSGVAAGSLTTMAAALVGGRLLHLDDGVLLSLGPKSVTVPIAVEISRLTGGDASLTAAFVVATGMIGSIAGPLLLTLCRVQSPVARGLALGTVSHGQGTAVALLENETAGAMGGVAMAIAAVFTALVAPYYLPLFLR
ncbi:LrgB family protein [Geomonas nitrogeniifigens]|uniref:LrgB family protein n=1 Tax=Geomonas diazotrophica TaxID=2843197 RepID=A0ABX8JTK2_9BACT|nr:LrgB family protein [Geomonas nitrogeniifigens]QWV98745.1 LrgB family protein [Geomonas nitrogeniifigens]QXE87902.1 LrgB family protein [Geomonas nitrogeniifigens]